MAVVKEVFGAAPGEGFIGGLLPDVEKLDCLAVSEDIEEAQEFPVDAAGNRQKGREERFVDIRGRIVVAGFLHFGASSPPAPHALFLQQTFLMRCGRSTVPRRGSKGRRTRIVKSATSGWVEGVEGRELPTRALMAASSVVKASLTRCGHITYWRREGGGGSGSGSGCGNGIGCGSGCSGSGSGGGICSDSGMYEDKVSPCL